MYLLFAHMGWLANYMVFYDYVMLDQNLQM